MASKIVDGPTAPYISGMLVNRLMDHLSVDVEPFAVCLLQSGWRLSLPGNPGVVLHFVVEGTGTLRSPGGDWPMRPLTLALVPRDIPHSIECGEPVVSEHVVSSVPECEGVLEIKAGASDGCDLRVACGLIHVTYGDSLDLFGRLNDVLVADLSVFPQAGPAFDGILAEQRNPADGSMALTRALMTQCLIYLIRSVAQGSNNPLPWLAALDDPGLGRALETLITEPSAHHTLDSLAEAAMMSRSAFAERFREAIGQPPLSFLHEIRLRKAAQLLERNRTTQIDWVAREVGLASRSQFSTAFKTRFGITPAAYRDAVR